MVIFLTRTYFPDGTNGKLECEGSLICNTIELPWKRNEAKVSCIPEGEYILRKRYSKKFRWHIEVADVESRSFILFHPANNAQKESFNIRFLLSRIIVWLILLFISVIKIPYKLSLIEIAKILR